jgi:hypothetical protein
MTTGTMIGVVLAAKRPHKPRRVVAAHTQDPSASYRRPVSFALRR